MEQVIQHNFGHLFGMHDIWDFLGIERWIQNTSINLLYFSYYSLICRLNDIWRRGWSGTKVVHIYLPECEEGPEEYFIVLCLRNVSNMDSEMVIKRKQLCSCRLKEVRDTFNITKYVYQCPHRSVITMDLSDAQFYVSKRKSPYHHYYFKCLYVHTKKYVTVQRFKTIIPF